MNTLPRKFYERDTARVARSLLGKRLVRRIGRQEISGIITETEAYGHSDDPASHAFGRITERNRAMFGDAGTAYVYFTYGMHYCFNAVARHPGAAAGAVLVRAIKPERGIKAMQRNRRNDGMKNLANGPAKLTQALKITKEHYGVDLTERHGLFITEGIRPGRISASGRIGIRRATEKMWNFKMEI